MLKVRAHPDYPPEEGTYLRGNDASPVAVAIILCSDADKIPPEIEHLVRAGVESGAALSGAVQTENIIKSIPYMTPGRFRSLRLAVKSP